MPETIQEEVDRNYEAFTEMLPALLAEHRGKYALMKDRRILGFYSTSEDARVAAESFIEDKLYSIQLVSNTALDLGFYTNAVIVA